MLLEGYPRPAARRSHSLLCLLIFTVPTHTLIHTNSFGRQASSGPASLQMVIQEHVRRQSRTRNGRFLSISSEAPLDWVLFDLLQRQGWLK